MFLRLLLLPKSTQKITSQIKKLKIKQINQISTFHLKDSELILTFFYAALGYPLILPNTIVR